MIYRSCRARNANDHRHAAFRLVGTAATVLERKFRPFGGGMA
jgi:hypothetical protein